MFVDVRIVFLGNPIGNGDDILVFDELVEKFGRIGPFRQEDVGQVVIRLQQRQLILPIGARTVQRLDVAADLFFQLLIHGRIRLACVVEGRPIVFKDGDGLDFLVVDFRIGAAARIRVVISPARFGIARSARGDRQRGYPAQPQSQHSFQKLHMITSVVFNFQSRRPFLRQTPLYKFIRLRRGKRPREANADGSIFLARTDRPYRFRPQAALFHAPFFRFISRSFSF